MGELIVTGVKLYQIEVKHNEKGNVFKFLSSESEGFAGFGEAYISTVIPGAIKGWKRHSSSLTNILVVSGSIHFCFVEARNDVETKSIFLRPLADGFYRLTIERDVWFAFGSQSQGAGGLILSITNEIHQPGEAETLPLDTFDFVWGN